ncbi:MAG TPA: BTAD domain-containing putative transcriptional regulator [Acidimicrobiales bacterium]
MDLRLLGSVAVVGPTGQRSLAPAARTLLAVLLARRRQLVSLDQLSDVLWGDAPPTTARPTLQTHLSKLRRVVGAEAGASIVHRPPGYVLEVDRSLVDADRFEDTLLRGKALASSAPRDAVAVIDEALCWWRGPALCEFADEPWARPEAVRLEELRLMAIEERAQALLDSGEHALAVAGLEPMVDEQPLRERPRLQLMRALHASGRQAEALRCAQEGRRLLGDELGLDPSAELIRLEQAIATDDPTLRATRVAEPQREIFDQPPRAPAPMPATLAATQLVGRDDEVRRLTATIPTVGLVTLTGPGGVGKTRLAFELARALSSMRDGVRLVELAPVADGDAVGAAVAAALGVERRPGRSLDESVIEMLAPLELVLVIDNCEHVLDASTRLIAEILRWCPGVHVLATSRSAMGMPGEHIWPITPLPVPPDVDAPVEIIATNPAVQVFANRAGQVSPTFSVDDANARDVAEICTRLDGIPLALELAAARMGSLPPSQLRARLNERFDLLRQGPAVEARHRTLVDLVQWSYELLTDEEQVLLDRLSVFAGGFDLDAAERTCGVGGLDRGRVLPLLSELVEKSLVAMDVDRGTARYRQLETIRQFGTRRLEGSADLDAIHRSHLQTFAAVATAAEPALEGPEEAAWGDRLEREVDNLRAAVRTAVTTGDFDTGLALVVAAREFSFRHMRYELVRWAEELTDLDAAHDHPQRPAALAVVAYGSFVRGDLGTAIEQALHSLTENDRLSVPSIGLAERTLGNALVYRGDREEGQRWMDRMVTVAEKSGIDGRIAHAHYMRSVARTSVADPDGGAHHAECATRAAERAGSPTALAQAAYATGLARSSRGGTTEIRSGLALLDEAAERATEAGNRWIRAFALTESLWLRARLGDTELALAGYRGIIETWHQSGDWANQWLSLRQLAGIFASVGRDEDAALLFGAVNAAGVRAALPLSPPDGDDLDELARGLEERLGSDAVAASRRRGELLRDEAVVATALAAIDELL